ncbi:MAG: outer membrane protein assembly factor BamA [Kiritimatiellia bacterium]|nr:outer membrane protein assembly factor BamA [Kiritimatiellia bacterium]
MILRVTIAAALLSAGSALHAAPQSIRVVKDVRVENRGPGRLDESFVRSHIALRPGSALDRVIISKDVKRLLDTGVFSDVAVEIKPLADEIDVIYALINKWRLDHEIVLVGVEHFRKGKVLKWFELERGDLVDDHVLGVKVRRVIDEYHKDHFRDVKVTWEINELSREEGRAQVVVTVDEGNKGKIKRISFVGNEAVSPGELLKAVELPRWWSPMRPFRRPSYDVADLSMYRTAIRDAYLRRGYMDVDVREPEIVSDEKGRPVIVVRITEGNVYRFGKISISGITLFPEQDVRRAIRAASGGIASSLAIQATSQSVRDYYGTKGYINTAARPVLDPDPSTHVVDVHFAVVEGTLTKIRNIVIRGNDRTRDKVIRRELLVYPGEIYNEVKVRRSERRINNLGYFGRAQSYPLATLKDDEKDLLIEVEEKPTGQFMIGAGFSSIDNLIGFAELSQGNFDIMGWPYFTGGGQKLKLRGEFGSSRTEFDISFTEPWFLNRRLSLGFDIYNRDVDYDDYDLQTTGFAIKLGKGLPGANRLDLQYRLERDVVSDISDTNEYVELDTGDSYYFSREEDETESSLRVSVSHDSRDNPFFPSRGTTATAFYSLSGSVLGFDTDLYRTGFKARQYFPMWFGHVLSMRCRYDTVERYGNSDEVGISDRLFLGGGRTLRGFEYRDVGPKAIPADDDAEFSSVYRPLGGKSLAMASVEYAVPIVKFVRIAAFYDIGNVWTDSFDIDLNDLASSTGVGIRLDMPGFPIRVDRAFVMDPDDEYTDADDWVIWIGYDY